MGWKTAIHKGGVRMKGENWEGTGHGYLEAQEERHDEEEKGENVRKISSTDLSCFQIYGVLWVSLSINQSGWGDEEMWRPCCCIYQRTQHATVFFLHVSPPKQTDSGVEQVWVRQSNIHLHPRLTFPKPIYLVRLVQWQEVWTTQDW